MPNKDNLQEIDNLEIDPLSDEALEMVSGGKSSTGHVCCSCDNCSNIPTPQPSTD